MTVKHIRRAVAILKANGAEDIGVRCGRHFHVDFFIKVTGEEAAKGDPDRMANGQPGRAEWRRGRMIISCSPRSPEMLDKIIADEVRKLKEGKLRHGEENSPFRGGQPRREAGESGWTPRGE